MRSMLFLVLEYPIVKVEGSLLTAVWSRISAHPIAPHYNTSWRASITIPRSLKEASSIECSPNQSDCGNCSLLAAPRNSSPQVSYRASSNPWADSLWIPLTDTVVRLTKLPSATFPCLELTSHLSQIQMRPPGMTWGLASGAPIGSPWYFMKFLDRPI